MPTEQWEDVKQVTGVFTDSMVQISQLHVIVIGKFTCLEVFQCGCISLQQVGYQTSSFMHINLQEKFFSNWGFAHWYCTGFNWFPLFLTYWSHDLVLKHYLRVRSSSKLPENRGASICKLVCDTAIRLW